MHYYLLHLQYLGFGYHGWAKQPHHKTLHQAIDKTLSFVLGKDVIFKTLGCSRTDARVSANHFVLELFMQEEVAQEEFMEKVNVYLPPDIKLHHIEQTNAEFNIIQAPKEKEYHYLFACGQKAHPFAAPFMALFPEHLDLELMKKGAQLFLGMHNLRKFCYRPPETITDFEREINYSRIETYTEHTASFFPEQIYVYKVKGKGFMRNQIRLMMGQLIELGRGNITLKALEESIKNPVGDYFAYKAPAAGLMLNKVEFS